MIKLFGKKKEQQEKRKFKKYIIPLLIVLLCIAVVILLTDKVMTVKAGDEVNMEIFNNTIAELNTKIEDLRTKIKAIEIDTASNKTSIEAINPKVSSIEEELSEINKKISSLTTKVNTISEKLDNVEEDSRIVGTWINKIPGREVTVTFRSNGTCKWNNSENCFYKNNILNLGLQSIGNYFLRSDGKLIISNTVGGNAIMTRAFTKQ